MEKHGSVPGVQKVEAQMKGGEVQEEGRVSSTPVKEEDSSDHLIGIGSGTSSPHLLPIQDVKHTLPKEKKTLQQTSHQALLGRTKV